LSSHKHLMTDTHMEEHCCTYFYDSYHPGLMSRSTCPSINALIRAPIPKKIKNVCCKPEPVLLAPQPGSHMQWYIIIYIINTIITKITIYHTYRYTTKYITHTHAPTRAHARAAHTHTHVYITYKNTTYKYTEYKRAMLEDTPQIDHIQINMYVKSTAYHCNGSVWLGNRLCRSLCACMYETLVINMNPSQHYK